nr:hypothetical protein B0A51_12182 [Rachicladosporium sp. CCFEE 5018]
MSWSTALIVNETIIDSSPAEVRTFLLDFNNVKLWTLTSKLIKDLLIERGETHEQVAGIDAKEGDIIKVLSTQVGWADATIYINTPTHFGYQGGAYGFKAQHWWEFLPLGPENDSKTRFRHCEQMSGWSAPLFWPRSPLHSWLKGLFDGFDKELKAAVEQQSSSS